MSDQPFVAKLVRGQNYYLRDTHFERGVAVPVDDETREYLSGIGEDRLRYIDPDDGEAVIERVAYFEFAPNPAYEGAPT